MKRGAMILILMAMGVSAWAQWPEEFTNLKVLSEDISLAELRDKMFAFNRALGVRCSHCHVGEDMAPLKEYDFASDDKEAKRKARTMLSMVNEMNANHLEALNIKATCYTCHGGVTDPRPLETILEEVYAASGMAGVEERYTAMRERHHGRGRYDFGGSSLNRMAFGLEEKEKHGDAEAIHRLNLKFNPDYDHGHFKLGCFAFLRGDRQEARERFTTAIKGKPNNAPTWHATFAWGLLRKGEPDKAMDAAQMLIDLAPDQPHGYYVVGEVHLAGNRTAEARQSFERSLSKMPGFPPAQGALSRLEKIEKQEKK